MSDLDPAIIKKTQNSLGKYVKKPALTEKLLKKPPFRFLHDVINVVIRETNFLQGLYTLEELNSDNFKEREAKIAYLQKLIDATKAITGKELKVRPSKVIAGLEPEKTNELLQVIGYALEKKLSSSSVVQSYHDKKAKETNGEEVIPVVNGSKTSGEKSDVKKSKDKAKEKAYEKDKPRDTEKDKSRSKPKRAEVPEDARKEETKSKKEKPEKRTKEKDKSNHNKKDDKHKTDKEDAKPSGERKKLEKSKSKEKEKSLKRADSIKNEPVQLNTIDPLGAENDSKDSLKENESGEANGKVASPAEDELVAVIDEEAELRRIERNSSRRSSLKKQGSLTPSENNVLGDLNQYNGLDIQDQSRQISSALGDVVTRHDSDPVEPVTIEKLSAKPPIHRQQSVDSVMRPRTSLRPPSVRPPSARPGAPRRKEKNVEIVLQPNETTKLGEINVKMEVFNNELLDDDGENLVVIEDSTVMGDDDDGLSKSVDEGGKELQEQGHLVRQILETQKEFSNIAGEDGKAEVAKKVEMEWSSNQRQSSSKQTDILRESIQKLTRSVNPLGKLMDFLQEDIDSMERELTNWQQVYSQAAIELNKERSANESAIEPLKHQLAQIEGNIREYREMIDITRCNILHNEQKIERLYMTEI
ncbi:TRAF3-interacting protein 1 [Wyeomyia smithii]|uniref:TRAF3-interacting protein 1 n=1 Tax=Wyeomyia smithii TaxID=174621 RepID=UPI00246820D3|nr:TRAF3-interacting protein 1 [Wyeomyia smithii]XP_055526297.1 TRAF3-interacting protein 1 [Wyeomyia smithii]